MAPRRTHGVRNHPVQRASGWPSRKALSHLLLFQGRRRLQMGRGWEHLGLRRGHEVGCREGCHRSCQVWRVQAAEPSKALGALGGKSGAASPPHAGSGLAGKCGSWLGTGPGIPRDALRLAHLATNQEKRDQLQAVLVLAWSACHPPPPRVWGRHRRVQLSPRGNRYSVDEWRRANRRVHPQEEKRSVRQC